MQRKLLAALLLASLPASALEVPDPKATPGAVNPAVTQANVHETICKSGYTGLIRPPAKYTSDLKRKQLASGPYKSALPLKAYEEDHLISLELGGHPRDPANLWPEPWTGTHNAHVKDRCENALHKKVCSGAVTLKAAQAGISGNWIEYCKSVGAIR